MSLQSIKGTITYTRNPYEETSANDMSRYIFIKINVNKFKSMHVLTYTCIYMNMYQIYVYKYVYAYKIHRQGCRHTHAYTHRRNE